MLLNNSTMLEESITFWLFKGDCWRSCISSLHGYFEWLMICVEQLVSLEVDTILVSVQVQLWMKNCLKFEVSINWWLDSSPHLMSIWLALASNPHIIGILFSVVLEAKIMTILPIFGSDNLVASVLRKLFHISVLNWSLWHWRRWTLFYYLWFSLIFHWL